MVVRKSYADRMKKMLERQEKMAERMPSTRGGPVSPSVKGWKPFGSGKTKIGAVQRPQYSAMAGPVRTRPLGRIPKKRPMPPVPRIKRAGTLTKLLGFFSIFK